MPVPAGGDTSLATTAELSAFLKRTFTADETATAEQLMAGASELVQEYCGWHIAPSVTATVTADGSGSSIQPLPTMHLTAVNTVTEAGTAYDVTALDWSTYGVLEKQDGSWWTRRRRGVVADITHGFDTTPGWLVTLICAAAGRAFLAAPGVVQESAGGESVTYAQPSPGAGGAVLLLPAERVMLDRIAVPGAA